MSYSFPPTVPRIAPVNHQFPPVRAKNPTATEVLLGKSEKRFGKFSRTRALDRQFLEGFLQDPRKRWPCLWNRFGALITARIRSFGFSPEDIQDMVQVVSLQLASNDFRLLRNWDPERSGLSTYLTLIVTSRCLDQLNENRRRMFQEVGIEGESNGPIAEIHETSPTPRERLERKEQEEILLRCIDSLREEGEISFADQRILLLKSDGKTTRQIARSIGMSETGVGSRFHRCKGKIRKRLRTTFG